MRLSGERRGRCRWWEVRTIEPSVCEQTLLAPLFLFSVRLTVNYNFCAHEPYAGPACPPPAADRPDAPRPAMPAIPRHADMRRVHTGERPLTGAPGRGGAGAARGAARSARL